MKEVIMETGARRQVINADKAIDQIESGTQRAVDAAGKAAIEAAKILGAQGERLKQAEQRLMTECRDYVQANPIKALGIAAGAGFVLSRMLGDR
jgi:ElaB/YqjD/DUF883 family membrane-anchored ribosome-binding protein